MFEKVDNLRMTDIEASERYPNCYIAMRKDSRSSGMGTVLYVGDDQGELFQLVLRLENPAFCGVLEGLNLRRSLGGVVVGG